MTWKYRDIGENIAVDSSLEAKVDVKYVWESKAYTEAPKKEDSSGWKRFENEVMARGQRRGQRRGQGTVAPHFGGIVEEVNTGS